MKLLRVGDKGKEKPALLDSQNNFRDLSNMLADDTLSAAKNLSDFEGLKPALLKTATGCKGCHSRYRE